MDRPLTFPGVSGEWEVGSGEVVILIYDCVMWEGEGIRRREQEREREQER